MVGDPIIVMTRRVSLMVFKWKYLPKRDEPMEWSAKVKHPISPQSDRLRSGRPRDPIKSKSGSLPTNKMVVQYGITSVHWIVASGSSSQ